MATPTPKRPRPTQTPSNPSQQLVNPRWLLRALLIILVVAAILAYAALCLLVSMGSRQLILHPFKTVDRTPATLNIPFTPVRFDAATTGTPRLTAWWIPAAPPGAPSQPNAELGATPSLPPAPAATILLLHDATGNLSSTLPLVSLLHQANLNVFAIDYRGFGLSDPIRPTQQHMQQDAAAALVYLTDTRHIPAATIVPLGNGLGAVLAAQLLDDNPTLPALIVDNPDLVTVPAIENAPRARFLPMHLLLADHFDLAAALRPVTLPRLLIVGGPGDLDPTRDRAAQNFFQTVPAPRWIVTLPDPSPASATCPTCPGPAYISTIRRFLDESVPIPSPNPSGKP